MTAILLSIPYRSPLTAFAPFAGIPGTILFDSAAREGAESRWSMLCVAPDRVLCDAPDPFAALDALADQAAAQWAAPAGINDADLPPFRGGVAGWIGYEAGHHLERLPAALPDDLGVPDTAFGLYDVVVAFDHQRQAGWILGWPGREDKVRAVAQRLGTKALPRPVPQPFSLHPDQPRAQAEAAVQTIIDAIWAGEIFQANVTQRWSGHLPPTLGPWDLYRRLRHVSPAPFAALASFDGAHLLSASPERFLSVSASGQVETRPIKGTRPRGATPQEDVTLAAALTASAKDRAENLMIVDLLRNDLSRVCALGSVRVPSLCELTSFASVHHLVSIVEGQLRQGQTPRSLLRSAFPGGSITGAPKIHAMELLQTVEPCRRGPYCGSLFWLGADGAFDSSILIRTMVVGRNGRVAAQAGGGIVADSDPADEVDEAMVKVAPLLRAAAQGQVIVRDWPLGEET